MTYSFGVVAPTKTEVILAVEAKFDDVCRVMPVHEKDKDMVLAHLRNAVNLLPDPQDDEQITVSMHGSLSVRTDDGAVLGVTAGCSAGVCKKNP